MIFRTGVLVFVSMLMLRSPNFFFRDRNDAAKSACDDLLGSRWDGPPPLGPAGRLPWSVILPSGKICTSW